MFGHDGAIAHGADVEEKVAALRGDFAERVDDLAGRFPGIIRGVVTPALVEGHAGFPGACRGLRGDELLGGLEVAHCGETVVDEDPGLELADEGFEFGGAPLDGSALPAAIEPDDIDGAVGGEELADLFEHIRAEAVPLLGGGLVRLAEAVGAVGIGEGGIVGVAPVDQGEIEADAETLGTEGIDEFADEVAAVGGMFHAEIGRLGVEHGVAVVVLGGEDGVLHAEAPGHPGERGGVPVDGVEGGGGGLVFGDGEVAVGEGGVAANHGPGELDSLLGGVAPVDEHAEAGGIEPGAHGRGVYGNGWPVWGTG